MKDTGGGVEAYNSVKLIFAVWCYQVGVKKSKNRSTNIEIRKKYKFSNDQNSKLFSAFEFIILNLFRISGFEFRI